MSVSVSLALVAYSRGREFDEVNRAGLDAGTRSTGCGRPSPWRSTLLRCGGELDDDVLVVLATTSRESTSRQVRRQVDVAVNIEVMQMEVEGDT